MSGFPEKRLTSGEVGKLPGKSGELPGKSGKLPGNPWIAVKFHSERTSGEVTEKLPGKFGALPGKSGDFPEAWGSLTPSQRLAKFVSNLNCPKYPFKNLRIFWGNLRVSFLQSWVIFVFFKDLLGQFKGFIFLQSWVIFVFFCCALGGCGSQGALQSF